MALDLDEAALNGAFERLASEQDEVRRRQEQEEEQARVRHEHAKMTTEELRGLGQAYKVNHGATMAAWGGKSASDAMAPMAAPGDLPSTFVAGFHDEGAVRQMPYRSPPPAPCAHRAAQTYSHLHARIHARMHAHTHSPPYRSLSLPPFGKRKKERENERERALE
jgi:hypothetical protein